MNSRTGEVLPLYTDVLDDNEANAERLDILGAAGRITVPWLLVHGEADEAVSLEEGERLAAVVRHPASRHEWIAGGGHTFGARHPWAGTTPELERAFAASVAWFARYLAERYGVVALRFPRRGASIQSGPQSEPKSRCSLST